MFYTADYRKRAEDCAQKASGAQDEYHRKNFQQLSNMWAEMAAKAENRGLTEAETSDQALDEALATIRNA